MGPLRLGIEHQIYPSRTYKTPWGKRREEEVRNTALLLLAERVWQRVIVCRVIGFCCEVKT
jgi:hypothetical protein